MRCRIAIGEESSCLIAQSCHLASCNEAGLYRTLDQSAGEESVQFGAERFAIKGEGRRIFTIGNVDVVMLKKKALFFEFFPELGHSPVPVVSGTLPGM